MLGRTAQNLFWLSRYVERAENMARLLEVGYRMSLTSRREGGDAFSQIGNFIERADNTARILDMKYYVLQPRTDLIGGDVDIQQWTLILRAASAHRSYRHVYHDRYKAWNIADYLILRPQMPRSLLFSYGWINRTLDMLEEIYGGKGAGHEAAAEVTKMLEDNSMDRIFAYGLHEFLTEFISRNNKDTEAQAESYNFY